MIIGICRPRPSRRDGMTGLDRGAQACAASAGRMVRAGNPRGALSAGGAAGS